MPNQTVVPNAEWLDWLAALIASTQPLNGAKLHLYKTNINLGPTTDIGDLTECDFTGYTVPSAITWGTPFYRPDGVAVVTGDLKTFTVGATPTILNTVYGWYATNSGGTKLLLARQLDVPVILTQAAQAVEIVPSYPVYLPS